MNTNDIKIATTYGTTFWSNLCVMAFGIWLFFCLFPLLTMCTELCLVTMVLLAPSLLLITCLPDLARLSAVFCNWALSLTKIPWHVQWKCYFLYNWSLSLTIAIRSLILFLVLCMEMHSYPDLSSWKWPILSGSMLFLLPTSHFFATKSTFFKSDLS